MLDEFVEKFGLTRSLSSQINVLVGDKVIKLGLDSFFFFIVVIRNLDTHDYIRDKHRDCNNN